MGINKLNFPSSVDEYRQEAKKLIEYYDKGLQEIINIPIEKKTFSNTFDQIDKLDCNYGNIKSSITFLSNASTEKDIRDVANEVKKTLSKYQIETSAREDLYNAYVDCCKQNNQFKDSDLTLEQQRFIKKTLESFERNGLQLEKEKRDQLKSLKTKISELSIQFSKNISDDKSKLSFTPDQLKGIPLDTLESFEKDKECDGNIFVSLKYPEIIPALQYCEIESTRKQLVNFRFNQCNEVNTPIIEEIIKLRYQVAQLLGFPNWASYKAHYLMVSSNDNIQQFEERMRSLLEPHGKLELEKLKLLKQKYCQEHSLEFDGEFYYHDKEFFNNILLVNEYQVDDNLVKQYFPLEVVLKGTFDVYQELLSVKFTEETPHQPWHPDVKYYSVSDTSDGSNRIMGHFYIDLHPRDGKYNHAAVWNLIDRKTGEDCQIPVAAMLCNFTKPTETKPSLLTHDEVVTFFHEFGHVCHNMVTMVNYTMFSGTSTEVDFVECPSQLFENYCWDKSILTSRLSGHYLDYSKKLPSDLVDRMISSKNLNVSLFYLRQISLGLFDNAIHSCDGNVNTSELFHELSKSISLIPTPKGTNQTASFGHLMGYDAQYYSYLYSICFAACIFEKFKQHGIMNKELGKKLRDQVLAVGGSQDSNITIENFLGSKPNESDFLKTIGL